MDGARGEAIGEILEEQARVAGDVIQIDSHTWAIHGFIAGDGEVLLAEFDRRESAQVAIEQLSAYSVEKGHRHDVDF
jgi:hypothetical protein